MSNILCRMISACGAVLCGTIASTAAAAPVSAPPSPGSLNSAPAPWMGIAIMFIFTAIVVSISLMPSKRSHQE